MKAAPPIARDGGIRETPFPDELVLTPLSRRPTRLPESTLRRILDREVPAFSPVTAARPPASVVVVTRNNLPFLRLCLESVLAAPGTPSELIVVDNASSDGTSSYLRELAERNAPVRSVTNESNRSFAAACNQGAELATADLLVLLNDDTAVTGDWLGLLAAHLGRPEVGMVGPVTNRIGNEAQIDIDYDTWGEFRRFAATRASQKAMEAFEIPTLTMFCLAMRRSLYEEIGPLDERFETGLLEDDDYSRRVRQAGYSLLCADDVVVHHFGETSFGKLVATGEYARLLRANQARFEQKWHEPWRPYERRQSQQYRDLMDRVRRTVMETVPAGATVLVVSRGDDALLRLGGRRARHFPRDRSGTYAGHHPADSDDAIARVEAERASGADYLVFPSTTSWWLEHYAGLRKHLEARYERCPSDSESCVIIDLRPRVR